MICGRKESRFARRGKMMKTLLQLLLTVKLLWSRDSEGGCELFSRCRTNGIVDAVVVGGVLLPHGDFALDPTFFPNGTVERDVADDVARGARRAGRWLVELQQKQHRMYKKPIDRRKENETKDEGSYVADEEPMIVLMTTPHGIKLDYDYGIYVSSKGSGSATIGRDCIGYIRRDRIRNRQGISKESSNATKYGRRCQHKPYNVTLRNIDLAPTALAEDLSTVLVKEKGHPVSGIYSYDDEAPIPLNWGEIVPLMLLPTTHALATSSSLSSSKNPVLPLIWTFPYRRYDHSVDMVPELLQIGADIMEWAQQRPEKIAIIVSGDLSHTHQSSGPYGYSAASALYDDAIGLWAGGQTNGISRDLLRSWDPCQPEAANALLNRAKELQPDAKSCGFTGYVMWHGMMCPSSPNDVSIKIDNVDNSESIMKKNRSTKFTSKVFVNRNVTYYGMIGAIFEPHVLGKDDNGNVGYREEG